MSFTDWGKCEPHPYELKRYPPVRRWVGLKQGPKLAHFLGLYLVLGKPACGCMWLSLNNTSGHAIPLGPMIQVPRTVSKWEDVENVIAQQKRLGSIGTDLSRLYTFGFFVGMIIGDAAKSKSKGWHRHLGLVLSKKYDTNEKIGDFTCICARGIGLRMHRIANQPKPNDKPHGFYQRVSQASPLID